MTHAPVELRVQVGDPTNERLVEDRRHEECVHELFPPTARDSFSTLGSLGDLSQNGDKRETLLPARPTLGVSERMSDRYYETN